MRKKLGSDFGVRKKFHAVFRRFGKKVGYSGHSEETILLVHVRDAETGQVLTDHLWFKYTKGFERAGIRPGQKIEFEARIKAYKKGYVNRKYNIDQSRADYRLSHPTKIRMVSGGAL